MAFWDEQRVLITGGAGLIGSYIAGNLIVQGARVRVVDNLSRGSMNNLITKDIEFGWADLTHGSVAMDSCSGIDIVMHLAAPSYGIAHSGRQHSWMLEQTLRLGMNVLEAAIKQKVKQYLFVSSSCVYPDWAIVPTPEGASASASPERANGGYGWGKWVLEQQLRYVQEETGMDIRIVRPFNTYGPRVPVYGDGRDHLLVGLIHRILTRKSQPLTIWGDGTQTRSLIHASDVADMIIAVAEQEEPPDGPLNIGSCIELPVAGLAKRLLSLIGESSWALLCDQNKPVGATRKAADCTRLQNYIGLKQEEIDQYPLEQGLREMCQYVKTKLETQRKPD